MFRTTVCLLAAVVGVHAGSWAQVATLNSTGTSVTFSDSTHGFMSGLVNGGDAQYLFQTSDGGKSWKSSIVTSSFGIPTCVAANPPNILVSSLIDSYVSNDGGQTFKVVEGEHAQASQGCRFEAGDFFEIGYGPVWGSGVAVSTNGGKSFVGHNITTLPYGMLPVFGSFESSQGWYVTAGTTPNADDDDGFYTGAIVRSTDQGSTWHVVYQNPSSTIYEIACADSKTCCATAGAAATSFIVCTADGTNWNTVWTTTDHAMMQTMTAFGKGQWVSSGTLINDAKKQLHAVVLRSSDNGKTWTEDDLTTLPQIGLLDASFPSPDSGFIVGIDRLEKEMLFSYTA